MAKSAKYLKAIASKKIVAKSRTSGEIRIVFQPNEVSRGEFVQPRSIKLGEKAINLLNRSDVTLDDIKRSNLAALVSRGAVDLVL